MPSVWIEIEDEAQDAARRVVSNSYDPDEWCEPQSIRQDIKDLQTLVGDMEVVQIAEDISSIEDAVRIIRTSLDTIEEMLKRISNTPTMKQELDNMDYHRQQQGDSYDD